MSPQNPGNPQGQGSTTDMALRLGKFFRVDPRGFMNMRTQYERIEADGWPTRSRRLHRRRAAAPEE